jgi:hypothetical protein
VHLLEQYTCLNSALAWTDPRPEAEGKGTDYYSVEAWARGEAGKLSVSAMVGWYLSDIRLLFRQYVKRQ